MNGARTTLMRKGYWLTALAAAVLLAASSGTALAQNTTGVTIEGPSNNTVNEGGTAAYTVAVRGYVKAAKDAQSTTAGSTVTVSLAPPKPDDTSLSTAGDDVDLNGNAHVLSVSFTTPSNSSTDNALLFTGSKTISVATLHDNDAENEHFKLKFELNTDDGLFQTAASKDKITLAAAGQYNPNTLIIDDDETQGYTLTQVTEKPTEGTSFEVNLKASPAHEDGSGTLQVNIDKQSGWNLDILSGDGKSNNPTVVGGKASVLTITQNAGDGNRVTDTVTVSAHTGKVGASREEASLSIDVADADSLQAVKAMVVDKDGVVLDPQPTSVEEGKSVKIAVMPVDEDGKVTTANEALEIALAPSGSADARDYRLSTAIKIGSSGNKSNLVDLLVETDEDVGMETLMFDAVVSGEPAKGTETRTVPGVLSLAIVDATEKKIEPTATAAEIDAAIAAGAGDDKELNPGETVTLMTGDLFTLMAGYTASYGASVEGDSVSASTSGEIVTINALKAGESKVTVTGTASMAASSLTPSQDVSNVASVMFAVMVVDKVLVVTLEMPANVMNGNIVEGKSYDIMVSANRMITEAEGSVEVMIMRDRAKSDADDSDFTVSSATIMAGKDSATAELMVTEDMLPDSGTNDNMGEALVLYGMAGDMETNELTFTIWDQAVPALPLIGQLALALFLMLGGARLYRRRQG